MYHVAVPDFAQDLVQGFSTVIEQYTVILPSHRKKRLSWHERHACANASSSEVVNGIIAPGLLHDAG
jgi:hypothetical protein